MGNRTLSLEIAFLAVTMSLIDTGLEPAQPPPAGAGRSAAIEAANLGVAYQANGRYRDAESAYLRSVRIWQSIGGDDKEAAVALHNLAGLRRILGNYPDAERLQSKSLAMLERLNGPEHSSLAGGAVGLGTLYVAMGRPKDAEHHFRRALRLSEPASDMRATALTGLGELLLSLRRLNEAEPLLVESVALRERLSGSNHPRTATARASLAQSYMLKRDYRGAEALLRRALADVGPAERAVLMNNLGQACRLQGRRKEAERYLRLAIGEWESSLGADHPNLAPALLNLAQLQIESKKYEDAEAGLMRALSIDEKRLGPNHPNVARDLARMAALHRLLRHDPEAERLYRRALTVHEASGAPTTIDQADWLEAHAGLLRSMAKNVEAARNEAKANGIRYKNALRGKD